MAQPALPFNLNVDMLFANWLLAPNNQAIVTTLKKSLTSHSAFKCYLYGGSGLGKTHLLQASVQYVLSLGKNALYFDASGADICHLEKHLANVACLALDNIDKLGKKQQQWLFELYQWTNHTQCDLLVSAQLGAKQLGFDFIDVKTRLTQMLQYQLNAYDDEILKKIITSKMKQRSLEISAPVYHYLLTHQHRDIKYLLAVLKCVEQLAIERQKKISVPLVKQVLAEHFS